MDFGGRTPETGFTGGQNLNIRHALAHGYDYVFLLNNDTVVDPEGDCRGAIHEMSSDPRCRAASPVIARLGNRDVIDFCGAIHEWRNIDTLRPASWPKLRVFWPTTQIRFAGLSEQP